MGKFSVVLVLGACATIVSAYHGGDGGGGGHGGGAEDNGPAHYHFDYSIADHHTGDKKSQYETRDGHVVKGGYTINEPDGTIRVVEYHADPKGGFTAVVKKIGQASHPAIYGKGGGEGGGHGGSSGGHGGDGGGHGGGHGGGGLGGHSSIGITHWGYGSSNHGDGGGGHH